MAESMPAYLIEKEFERKRAYDIVTQIDREQFSVGTCEWAVRGYASIASHAMIQKNAESMADFLDDGGCESLVNIMTQYSEVSEKIAAYGCMAISILAWSLRELKEFLGEIGACEVVVFATSMHIGDPKVSEYGTNAIGQMAKQNISNSFRLAKAGACDILAQVGNFGFNLRHESCIAVATNVCYAFAHLSEAVNAKRLAECGSSGLVVALTKLHMKDKDFALAAVKALCALSSLNAFHREELGNCDGCKYVVEIIGLHDNVTLCLEGCEAIMHLSLSPNNADKIGASNGCEVVATALKGKLFEVDFGTEVCTGAMLNLATYGINAAENREKLVKCGSIDMLKRAQFSPKASYKARENIQALLDLLGAENVSSNAFGRFNTGVNANLVKVINGSEMKGSTVPLKVEVREVIEYDSFTEDRLSSSPDESDSEDYSNQLSKRGYTNTRNGVFEI